MHYIRDERGDEALTLCRPMGLGFPAVRTRQEGKEKKDMRGSKTDNLATRLPACKVRTRKTSQNNKGTGVSKLAKRNKY